MSKWLITGDWQATFQNLDTCIRAHGQEMMLAKRYHVAGILDVGDLKDVYNPIEGRVLEFQTDRWSDISNCSFLSLINMGNHDRIGQHDDKRNWIGSFKAMGVDAISRPKLVVYDHTIFACLPYINDKKVLKKAASKLWDKASKYSQHYRKVLLFHCDVNGADYGLGQRSESVISARDLMFHKWDFSFGGHIHKHQYLATNAMYVGNPFCFDWGEVNQEKGFILYNDETNTVERLKSTIPSWYTYKFLRSTDVEKVPKGARIKVDVKCKLSEDYYAAVTKRQNHVLKRYPDTLVYTQAIFIDDENKEHAPLIEASASDLDKIKSYVSAKAPESLEQEKTVKYLEYVLQKIVKATRSREGLTFEAVKGRRVLSYDKVDFSFSKRGIILVLGKNKDWPKHSNGCIAEGTYIDVPRDLKKHPKGIKIENLVGKYPWVYAYDRHKGLCLKKALWVKQTGQNVPVVRLKFRETFGRLKERVLPFIGELTLTPEHLVMLRNGSYRKAIDLKPGDRVMPFYRRSKDGSYYGILDNKTGKCLLENRFILGQLGKGLDVPWHGHHRNEKKYDNRIKNLEAKYKNKHAGDHSRKLHAEGRSGWQNSGKPHPRGMLGKKHSKAGCLQIVETLKKTGYKKRKKYYKTLGWTKAILNTLFHKKGMTVLEIARKYKTSKYHVFSALDFFDISPVNNHRILSVVKSGYSDVYDICVPDTHNFVANGVVVHNSGKTNFLSLLPIALEDQTLKEQKKNSWVTEDRDGKAYVELNLRDRHKNKFKIHRGRKPTKLQFFINGKDESESTPAKTQALIQNVLGFTLQTLKSSVYIDASLPKAFIQGTQKERTDLISRFQNLERFKLARDIVAKDVKHSEDTIESLIDEEYKTKRLVASALDEIKAAKKDVNRSISKLKDDVVYHKDRVKRYQKQRDGYWHAHEQTLAVLTERYNHADSFEVKIAKEIYSITDEMETHKTKISKFSWKVCPTCMQEVPRALRKEVHAKHEKAVEKLNDRFQPLHDKQQKLIKKKQELGKRVAKIKMEMNGLSERTQQAEGILEAMYKTYKDQKESAEKSNGILKLLRSKLKKAKASLRHVRSAIKTEADDKELLIFGMKAFSRDGIPLYLNSLACPLLNKAAAAYSDMFTDGEIQVIFRLNDGEFEPVVANLHGSQTIEGQSTGEMAWAGWIAALALRELAPPTNLLALDEPGYGLDSESAKVFATKLSLLKDKFDTILVVTHNETIASLLKSDKTVTIEKQNKVSKLIE